MGEHKLSTEDEIQYLEGEIEHKGNMLIDIKGIVSDLYASRGEDEYTALACNKILKLIG